MRKKISISTTITLLILTMVMTVSITMRVAMRYFNQQVQSVSERQAMYTHINEVDKKVRDYYQVIDEEALQQGITAGYIKGLNDPYAAYFTPTDFMAEELRLSGKANNMGVELCYDAEENVTVCKVHADSAAAKAGVKKGDIVLAMDSVEIKGKSLASLQNQLNTASKVLLTVKRGNNDTAFELSAYEYTVRSVESTVLDDVGYVKISAFYQNTPDQFISVVSSLTEQGVSGIVFDLRNNTGGSREVAQRVISYMMPLGMYGSLTGTNGVVTKLAASVSSQLS